jgi:hypothetical protein
VRGRAYPWGVRLTIDRALRDRHHRIRKKVTTEAGLAVVLLRHSQINRKAYGCVDGGVVRRESWVVEENGR